MSFEKCFVWPWSLLRGRNGIASHIDSKNKQKLHHAFDLPLWGKIIQNFPIGKGQMTKEFEKEEKAENFKARGMLFSLWYF